MPENSSQSEQQRLAVLGRYGALSDIPDSTFDRLTRLAARLFSAPIAMVSFVEERRVLIKGSIGMDVHEAAREETFCPYVIVRDEAVTVPNALEDCRFRDTKYVAGEPHLRFFAGAPLITADGFRLGALCVLDTAPRPALDASALALLQDLAAQAVEVLELYVSQLRIAAMETELDAQRQQLEESRELWRKTDRRAMLALRAGKMGYWERDPATDLVTFSPSLSAILGLPSTEHSFTMDQWLSSIANQDLPSVLETIEHAQRTGENYVLKYRTVHRDGREIWVSSSGRYYADSQGRFGAQGVAWDSTDVENAARRLEMSEKLFRGLSEAAPMGVYRADLSGHVTYANPRTLEIWQMPLEKLLGHGWLTAVHPMDRTAVLETIRRANQEGVTTEFECRILRSDGSTRWISARSSFLVDENGTPIGKIGTVDDVTERREAIAELQEAKEAAEIANRTKDRFLANVSHELRTPLNGVLGMAQMLLDASLTPEQKEMAEIIRGSGRLLLSLVNDMLDLGRIEAGTIIIERNRFSLPDLLRKPICLLDPELKRKQLSIRCVYAPGVPTCFWGDEQRIEQILLNYLSNAVKFTESGEIVVSVRNDPALSAMEHQPGIGAPCVLLSVADNGPGIAQEAQHRLFQPFSQIDASSTRRTGGVGLGLAIAKRLAELMGGSVGVRSAPGRGSTFWVRLPLSVAPPMEERLALPSEFKSEPAGRILLAEDNPINQKVALSYLRKLGWEADVATDGAAALSLFHANQYALVLMDCHMPEMDGLTATERIRDWEVQQERVPVPIVALTANAMKGDRERCLAAGMNDHLTKPFGISDLRDVLERWAVPHSLTEASPIRG